jgi:hypothetical protein
MGTRTPPGLVVLGFDGCSFLSFDPEHVDPPGSPWADARRTMGWYYGYPSCCVEAFVERTPPGWSEHLEAVAEALERGDENEAQRLADAWHPISGHALCEECASGPKAPLPPRVAQDYGFMRWDEAEDAPVFYEPSPYSLLVGEPSEPPLLVVEQLAFDLGGV